MIQATSTAMLVGIIRPAAHERVDAQTGGTLRWFASGESGILWVECCVEPSPVRFFRCFSSRLLSGVGASPASSFSCLARRRVAVRLTATAKRNNRQPIGNPAANATRLPSINTNRLITIWICRWLWRLNAFQLYLRSRAWNSGAGSARSNRLHLICKSSILLSSSSFPFIA